MLLKLHVFNDNPTSTRSKMIVGQTLCLFTVMCFHRCQCILRFERNGSSTCSELRRMVSPVKVSRCGAAYVSRCGDVWHVQAHLTLFRYQRLHHRAQVKPWLPSPMVRPALFI